MWESRRAPGNCQKVGRAGLPGQDENGDERLNLIYDYLGRGVRKVLEHYDGNDWVTDLDRRFVWYNWLMLLELDGDNEIVRKYTWGLDLAGLNGGGTAVSAVIEGAGGIGGLLALHDPDDDGDPNDPNDVERNYVYFYDANGNVGQLIDWEDDGTLVAKYEYDPYGGNLLDPDDPQESGPYAAENPIRFSTKYFDDETALGYWGYRYYSPGLGRWLSREPLGELGSLNLYRAFRNSAYSYYDYLGREDRPNGGGDNPPEDPPSSQPSTQPAVDKSQACCYFKHIPWPDDPYMGRRTLDNCYKTVPCEKCTVGPADCCKCICLHEKDGRYMYEGRTLVGAAWGKCCFCKLRIKRQSWRKITPHHVLELSCPDFSRLLQFYFEGWCPYGAGLVDNLLGPDTIHPIIVVEAEIPCETGQRLRWILDHIYPEGETTQDYWYIFPFQQCRSKAWEWYVLGVHLGGSWRQCR